MTRLSTPTPHVDDTDSRTRLLPYLAPFRGRLVRGLGQTINIPASNARLIIAAAIPRERQSTRVRKFRKDR